MHADSMMLDKSQQCGTLALLILLKGNIYICSNRQIQMWYVNMRGYLFFWAHCGL